MSDVNYNELATSGWNQIPEEVVLPAGHWRLQGAGMAYFKAKEEGKSAQVAFFYKAVAPSGDVNAKALKELGDYDWSQNEIRNKDVFFFSSPRDKMKIASHLGKHKGFDLSDSEGLLVVDEKSGEYRINPKAREAFMKAQVDAKLGIDEYDGTARNVASEFTAIEG